MFERTCDDCKGSGVWRVFAPGDEEACERCLGSGIVLERPAIIREDDVEKLTDTHHELCASHSTGRKCDCDLIRKLEAAYHGTGINNQRGHEFVQKELIPFLRGNWGFGLAGKLRDVINQGDYNKGTLFLDELFNAIENGDYLSSSYETDAARGVKIYRQK